MILFLSITLQQKGGDDWRAFLHWADTDKKIEYELRGYGSLPGEAANDAWKRYNEKRDEFVTYEGPWE